VCKADPHLPASGRNLHVETTRLEGVVLTAGCPTASLSRSASPFMPRE
jgi:hypothetical protein